jgi:hypothetical protein
LEITDFNEDDHNDEQSDKKGADIAPSIPADTQVGRDSTVEPKPEINKELGAPVGPELPLVVPTNNEPNHPAADAAPPADIADTGSGGMDQPDETVPLPTKPPPRPGLKWKPPSLEKAKEYRLQSMYHQGSAALWGTDLVTATDLSKGAVLHFFFLRSVIICMAVMSVLSFPILVFSISGSRIPLALKDPIGLYQFTLGNIGYDPTSESYQTDSACTKIPDWRSYNGTCVHVMGGELKLSEVANIVTTFEFLQVVAFYFFVFYFSSMIGYQGADAEENGAVSHTETEIAVTDYTIMIRNLPETCTELELAEHFSKLYQLTSVDWKERPPIVGTEPADNAMHPEVAGSWVANCTVFYAIGRLLSAFKKHRALLDAFHRAEAAFLMYSDGTRHIKGRSPSPLTALPHSFPLLSTPLHSSPLHSTPLCATCMHAVPPNPTSLLIITNDNNNNAFLPSPHTHTMSCLHSQLVLSERAY